MHSVQADGTLCSPHVEAHSETMRDVVVHSLLHTTTKLCNAKKEEEVQRLELLKEKYNTEMFCKITLEVSKRSMSVFKQHGPI